MHLKPMVGLWFALACAGSIVSAEDWRQFRGPGSNGVVKNLKLPEVWDVESHIKWKSAVPGEGWSAPIVVGGKVFVTTAVTSGSKNKDSDHVWKLICLDAQNGQVLWSKDALTSRPRLGNPSRQHVCFGDTCKRRLEDRGLLWHDGPVLL